ncbi:MAG: DNA-3-methyladenine glycosylase 2 family protein [Oscillospiraceae bacterium]|jgi:N-glycosylase/DNA lyase|nr:DNA-3-methyladenine glycosylase 2 family protein [Oscillospiraceae bacterium]
MKIERIKGATLIADCEDFDPVATFDCGQCFRWAADETGAYTGVAFGRVARVSRVGDSVKIECSQEEFDIVWRDYFDLGLDYAAIRESFCVDEHMRAATAFGTGIRILRQEPWEALCSFIISQCNNIPRIKKIVETLCLHFGEPISGTKYCAFPSAKTIAALSETDLAPLRAGYRAEYIIGAARAVASGELDLDALTQCDAATAREAVKSLRGVGNKVADCAVLFGLHRLDAFPIDTWVKKALARWNGTLDPKVFSPYAGIAQQYIFYYERSGH